MVVEHHRISAVRRLELTRPAKSRPKRVDGSRSHCLFAGPFVVNRNRYIHDLYELGFARRAVCIRRHKGKAEDITRILGGLPLEVQICCHTLQSCDERLRYRVLDLAAKRRPGGQGFDLLLGSARRVRTHENHVA